jgi:hypothetical protein
MECDRCGAPMLEEHVAVSDGLVKLKNISAWHCTACKRVEYGTTGSLAAATHDNRGSRSGFSELS